MRVSEPMLRYLEQIRKGITVYLADVPSGTRNALLSKKFVCRCPNTRRAQLTHDGELVCAGAAAARRKWW